MTRTRHHWNIEGKKQGLSFSDKPRQSLNPVNLYFNMLAVYHNTNAFFCPVEK
jgi:hypothetical protein